MLFHGSMTAVVTPFRDGKIDESAFRKIISRQISAGTDVIVPCGTTGESATLTSDERIRIVKIAVEESLGRAAVLAGAGSNSTETAIKLAKQVKSAGADGMLQVTPYYNKPTQEGLYQHFRAIASVVDLPMVLYNVPCRTSINMTAETTLRLAEIDTIVGIKEAGGNIEQIRQIIAGVPGNFSVFSGDDAMNFEIYSCGGKGCISVTSNIVPEKVVAVWDAFSAGRPEESEKLHEGLSLLNKTMFIETNPIPVKTALSMMGHCHEEFRLPLTPMSDEHREELRSVLKKYNLI